jgi:DNA-binding NarL/FixJ family response regulator
MATNVDVSPPDAVALASGATSSVEENLTKLRVMLVDDHQVVVDGLRAILEQTNDIMVVAEASNGEDAVRLALEYRPQVVLMNIGMPGMDGIQVTEIIGRTLPQTQVVILTRHADPESVIEAFQAGARSYLLKHRRAEDVIRAIRLTASGGSTIDPVVAPTLLHEYHRRTLKRVPPSHNARDLSERDVTLLRLLSAGYNNRQIAAELELAESTVKNTLSVLVHKIGVRDRTQAMLFAISECITSRSVVL